MIDQQGVAYRHRGADRVSADVLFAERVALLFGQSPVLVAGTLLTGAIEVMVMWPHADARELLGWLGVLYAWTALRVVFGRAYFSSDPAPAQASRWAWGTAGFSTVFGIIWGVGALLFYDPQAPVSMVLMPVMILGLNAGAAVSLVAFPLAYVGFALMSNALLLTALWLRPAELTVAFTLLVLVSGAVYLGNVRLLHRMLADSIRLRWENQYLRRETDEKSALLETTLSNIDQGIGLLDRQGRLRMWNARLMKLAGVPDEARQRLDDRTLTRGLEPLDLEPEFGGEAWRRGDDAMLELQRKPTVAGETVLTLTDVTLLRRREQAREEAVRLAEQADRTKTRFLAAASHDLRQPVHALGLLHSALQRRTQDTELDHLVEQIGRAIATSDDLLSDLLDISRLEAGVECPQPGLVELDGVFDELWEEFRAVARERNDYLRLRPTTLVVYSDRRMLMRILRNLIANALKYTRNGRVLVTARQRGDEVEVAVRDTGPGIPPHQQELIFEAFQQLHNPQRDRRHGLGLGLAIVRHSAMLLDHTVSVSSRVGSGSCFTVRMPLVAGNTAPEESPVTSDQQEPDAADELAGLYLWLIDDDPIVLLAMQGLLREWGCRVTTAADYDQALLLAGKAREIPDALLVDYRLPAGRTGLETVRAMRERFGVEVPSMLITGDTGPERLREARDGDLPLHHKPLAPDALRQAVLELVASPHISPGIASLAQDRGV